MVKIFRGSVIILCRVKTWFLLVILFLVVASSGCGGGSGGGGNSQDSSEINGTWEIVSGFGIRSLDVSGKVDVTHYTYVPGKIGAIGVEISRNPYGGTYEGAYCLTLTGRDLTYESIYKGTGTMSLVFIDEKQDIWPVLYFSGSVAYDYIDNGTYRQTDESFAKYSGQKQNLESYESTIMLEDSSTLIWTYYSKLATTVESLYEIVLKRAGTNDNNTTPNTNTNIPPQISGTWRVTSGSGTATQTVSGNPFIGHLTYTPEIRTEIGLEITQNDYSTYAGDYVGMYSLTLTGDNVINSGTKGGGAFRVPYTVSEYPEKLYPLTFNGGKAFKYAGNGIYRMTKADIMGYNDNSQGYEYALTLEDANTLKWQYFIPSEGTYELVLSKAQ